MKKLSLTWNTVLAYLGGGLILYVLFRISKKKKNSEDAEVVLDYTSNQSLSSNSQPKPLSGPQFTATPNKSQLTYEELFNWMRAREGVVYNARRDGVDRNGNVLFSIGMGHQIQPNEEYLLYRSISEEEVRQLFKKDIEAIVADVESVVRVPLNRNQKLALISIRYNVGPAYFRDGNLIQKVNARDFSGAAALIPNFKITSNGGQFNLALQNRRKLERDLFVKPV